MLDTSWIYWIPVGLGTGIGLYFSCPQEPLWSLWAMMTLILGMLWASLVYILPRIQKTFFQQRIHMGRFVAAALTLICMGMTLGACRTALLHTPLLCEELPPQWIEGELSRIEHLPSYQRILLKSPHLSHPFTKEKIPALRLSLRGKLRLPDTFTPGDHIRLKAVLLPPSEPVAPHAYDFRRRAYFEGISAVGYGIKTPEKLAPDGQNNHRERLHQSLEKFRHFLTQTLRSSLHAPMGEIAAALVTGDRSGIGDDIRQAFADSGTAHLLAISGLHLSVVAGFVFFLFRTLLSLIPFISLRFPIKKWAAAAAFFAILFYLLICAAPLPAKRAFLMSSLVLFAILIDRHAITLRNVALAATCLLIFMPESLISPSFQLSFAAVTALVAAYEYWGRRQSKKPIMTQNIFTKSSLYFLGVTATTLMATLATTPYIAYTFNKFTLQAIPANFIAVPWTTFIIMPLLALNLLLMPFDLHMLLSKPLEYSLEILLNTATTISGWPGAYLPVPYTSSNVLTLFTFGGLFLCLVRSPNRWWGLVPCMAAGIVWTWFSVTPDIFISKSQQVVGFKDEKNQLWVTSLQGGRFARESWQKMMAGKNVLKINEEKHFYPWEIEFLDKKTILYKKGLKIEQPPHVRISHILTGEIYLDEKDLAQKGGVFIWTDHNGSPTRLFSVKEWTGNRPWSF